MPDTANSDLRGELETAVHNSRRMAVRNYKGAYKLTILGAMASISTTIIVALGQSGQQYWQEFTAVLATVPAAAMLLETRLRLEDRSRWHWTKNKQLEALLRALKYEKVPEQEVSKRWGQVEIQLEEVWVGLNWRSNEKAQAVQ